MSLVDQVLAVAQAITRGVKQQQQAGITMDAIAASVATIAAGASPVAVTDFPLGAAEGKMVYHSSLKEWFVLIGGYWCGQRRYIVLPDWSRIPYTGAAPVTISYLPVAKFAGYFYCEQVDYTYSVSTTNDASNYWTFGVTDNTTTPYHTISTAGKNPGGVYNASGAVNADLPASAAYWRAISKVGAPGAFNVTGMMTGYMRIASS